MNAVLPVLVLAISTKYVAFGYSDLIPAAITVYRNPEFFKNLKYGGKNNYNQNSATSSEGEPGRYKYPGETKKPNPPPESPGFEVNYDNSPEFHHEPRDIFVDTSYTPNRKRGPYSPRHKGRNNYEPAANSNALKSARDRGSGEEGKERSRESLENDSGEEPRDFVSEFNESSDEEFGTYHEPILLARPSFDPAERSSSENSAYNQPYPYNRTTPLLYDDWKFYAYPKIHANEHLKSDSKFYSQEPPSNAFEDEPSSSSYHRYDDESEDVSASFEDNHFKNLGADTKHIYKKLLKPKKSFLFKFHSKPKFKKIKFHLKKKHPLKKDWFDEYPFDF